MLCASSMTTSTGSRLRRRLHSEPSTASATIRCSSSVSSDPRSTTTQRLVGFLQLLEEGAAPRAPDRPVEHAQVDRPHAQLLGARVRASSSSWSRPVIRGCPLAFARSRSDSTAYSSRSAIGSSPRTAPWVRGSSSANRSRSWSVGAGLVAPHRDVVGDRSIALGQRRVGAVAEAAQPDVVGVRVEDHDRAGSSRRAPARAGDPSEYVFPEPDCPHMKVCRLSPPLSSSAGTPGASISSPMTRLARS